MKQERPFDTLNGALLIDKHAGVSSFGIIEEIQRELLAQDPTKKLRRRDLPKIGHGGTLDPFATGLLIVCIGQGVKLARYFLGSGKVYEGVIRFGETTIPGDPTAEISERSEHLPGSIEEIQAMANGFTREPYSQTPPMHSAKKVGGKVLYELAREGIEIERKPKICRIHSFEILSYEDRRARFRVVCSSGTYIRTLSQDLGRKLGTVAMLDSLHRTGSGILNINTACTVKQLSEATTQGSTWDTLPCWVPFDRMLDSYDRAEATQDEATALMQGRQNVLFSILKRVQPSPTPAPGKSEDATSKVVIYTERKIIAVASKTEEVWGLERVFCEP